MASQYNLDKIDFEKRYTVIIVRDSCAKDGYDFYAPGDEIEKDGKKICMVTYYYKKVKNMKNPMTIIESIDGDEFRGRSKIISHFEMNYALKYSVERDGFYDL